MNRWTKTALIWGLLLALVYIGVVRRVQSNGVSNEHIGIVSPQESLALIDADAIDGFQIRAGGLFLFTDAGQTLQVVPFDQQVMRKIHDAQITMRPRSIARPKSTDFSMSDFLIVIAVVILALFAVVYFLRKKGAGQMGTIFEMRKTKARPVGDADKAEFTDIGGNGAAVEMLSDVVDFLRAPARWKAASARLPRGVLLVGPPGTGKTLLARAVAGETKSAFFYTSATEFVEMFVGVGPARIRDTFEKAAAQQPAVIFIDELDAVGRRRGSGYGTIHEEREQTLNQLLVMLDGLERHDRLVVIAATNRLDVLDPALLRSGRFDRVLRLEPPTCEERTRILEIHTRSKPLETGIMLDRIARQTDGFTGADLESLANDAALLAVRRCRSAKVPLHEIRISNDDFEQALSSLKRSNRQFNRLDSVVVESVSQFAEPTGRAAVRMTLTTGTVIEGDVVWMNSQHVKLRLTDGSEVIIAKEMAEQMVSLSETEFATKDDFTPDRWAGRDLDIG